MEGTSLSLQAPPPEGVTPAAPRRRLAFLQKRGTIGIRNVVIHKKQGEFPPKAGEPLFQALLRLFDGRSILGRDEPKGEIPPAPRILRDTLQIAWPSILESFLVALVGVIDTIMVGTLGSAAIAAVGLCTQPKFIALALFLSMNVAVSAIVARRKGQEDRESANLVLSQALAVTILLAVVVSLLTVAFAPQILRLAGSTPDTHRDAVLYYRIIMGGLFFNACSLVINAAQRVGILFSALVCLVFSTQGRRIFSLFFQEEAVLAEGVTLMRLAAAVVFLQISQVVFSGCLRGAGDVRYMALVSLSSATIARPVLGWLFCYGFGLGLTGAWIGLTLDQALRLLLSGARFVSGKWTRIKI